METTTPIQGIAALTISIVTVIITMGILWYNLRPEKKRPSDNQDDH